MSYLSTSGLMALGASLSERDRDIVETVARFGVASAPQLQTLFFKGTDEPATAARIARRSTGRSPA